MTTFFNSQCNIIFSKSSFNSWQILPLLLLSSRSLVLPLHIIKWTVVLYGECHGNINYLQMVTVKHCMVTMTLHHALKYSKLWKESKIIFFIVVSPSSTANYFSFSKLTLQKHNVALLQQGFKHKGCWFFSFSLLLAKRESVQIFNKLLMGWIHLGKWMDDSKAKCFHRNW